MKLRVLYLAFTVLMSATVLGLLVYVGYSWYIDNSQAKVTNVEFNTQEGVSGGFTVTIFTDEGKVVSAPLLPDEITMMKIELRDYEATSFDVQMKPRVSYKEVVRDSNNLISQVKTITSDPLNKENAITTITDLDKYYLVDEYYTYTESAGVYTKGNKVYGLTDVQKQEIFSSFYNNDTYDISNKIKYYVSDTLYKSDEYVKELRNKISGPGAIFQNVSDGINFHVDSSEQDDGKKYGERYVYFYFDPTDELFPYGITDTSDPAYNANMANYAFFGQNPYFYQSIRFDVLTTVNKG